MVNILKNDLFAWPKPLRLFLVGFLILLTSGVSIGIIYLFITTSLSFEGTIEHYNGSTVSSGDMISIPEKYEKSVSELLLTTHNHFIGFAFIFFILCGLFYFNSTINGFLKNILIVEPFISTWITFASLWGLKYVDTNFVYIASVAALFTYVSFYFLVTILLYELIFKNENYHEMRNHNKV